MNHNNGIPHTCFITRNKLTALGWEASIHPLYSTDLERTLSFICLDLCRSSKFTELWSYPKNGKRWTTNVLQAKTTAFRCKKPLSCESLLPLGMRGDFSTLDNFNKPLWRMVFHVNKNAGKKRHFDPYSFQCKYCIILFFLRCSFIAESTGKTKQVLLTPVRFQPSIAVAW